MAQNPFDLPAQRGLSSFNQNAPVHRKLDLRSAVRRRAAIPDQRRGIAHFRRMAMERGFHHCLRALLHAASVRRNHGHQPRRERQHSRECGSWPAIDCGEPDDRGMVQHGRVLRYRAPIASGGTVYGNAGRDILEGPAQFTFDSAINKTITIRESRSLELRLQASNIFNTAVFLEDQHSGELHHLRTSDRREQHAASHHGDEVPFLTVMLMAMQPQSEEDRDGRCCWHGPWRAIFWHSSSPRRRLQPPAHGGVLRVSTEIVLVNVVARDKHGNLIHDLKKEDFTVFEDGKKQDLASFDFEKVDEMVMAGAAGTTVTGTAGATEWIAELQGAEKPERARPPPDADVFRFFGDATGRHRSRRGSRKEICPGQKCSPRT